MDSKKENGSLEGGGIPRKIIQVVHGTDGETWISASGGGRQACICGRDKPTGTETLGGND